MRSGTPRSPGTPPTEVVSVTGRRGHNEDVGRVLQGEAGGQPVSLLFVADGMGGHAQGEVASRLAADALASRWKRLLADLGGALAPEASGADPSTSAADVASPEAVARAFLREGYAEAERRIAEEGHGNGMGTTLVAALVVGERALFANIGDSRGYVVREGGAELVTDDHSVVADAVRKGALTQEEAEKSPFQHALTRALDGTGDPEPDLFPASGWLRLGPAAAVILCSDGLSGVVEPDDLHAHLARTPDLVGAARTLAATAFDRGTPDNVTVALLEHGALARAGTPPLAPERVDALLAEAEPASAPPAKGSGVARGGPTGPAPVAEPLAPEVHPRESVGRTPWVLGAVALVLLALAALAWLSRDAESAAPRVPVVRGSARVVRAVPSAFALSRDADVLRWQISGVATRDDTARVTLALPADTLSQTVEVVGSSVPLATLAQAWPGEVLPEGEYVWKVEARSLSGSRLRSGPEPLILDRPVGALRRADDRDTLAPEAPDPVGPAPQD